MKKYLPRISIALLGLFFLIRFLSPGPGSAVSPPPQEEALPLSGLSVPSGRMEGVDRTDVSDRSDPSDVADTSGESEQSVDTPSPAQIAPEAMYGVNDPFGVISPMAHLVAGAVELERRELAPDAEGRPGRLRLMRADDFKYPLLRVEERFERFGNGVMNPFPELLVSVADHVMLQVNPDWDDAEVEQLARQLGGRLRERLLRPGLVLLELPEPNLDSLPQAIEASAQFAGVRFAEPDWVVGHLGGITPNDPAFPQLWGLPRIGAPEAWEITTGRERVVVAVLDTGVDYTHPDLQANIFYNVGEVTNNSDSDGNGFVDDIRGWDFYDNNNDPMDEHRHGSHVAGTIAAVGNNAIGITGVAWETRIMPMRFLGPGGSGPLSGAINSIAYTTMMGVDMTNNSWGGGTFSQAMYDTIAAARDAGILFVAAAGNSGGTNPGYPARYGNGGLPGGAPLLDNVISVAASSSGSEDPLASFSNRNAHLAAPGVGIYSTGLGNSYVTLNGTSMASPHVAGAAALLLAVDADLDYLELKQMLLDHVDDRSSDPEYELGIQTRGRLNINTALRNFNIPIMVKTETAVTDLLGPRAGNGVINPGERVELALSLRSVGMIDTENVIATLATQSPHITVTVPTHGYGSFSRYETRVNAQPFVFTVDPETPTPYEIPFELTITANGGHQWTEKVPLMVYTSVDIQGTVRHVDGAPFAGASVSYSGPFSGSTTTGTEGTYSMEIVDGTYNLFAEADGFRRSSTRILSVPPGTSGMDFVLGSSIIASSLDEIQAEARPGGRVELSIGLSNSGNLPLNWQLRETEYEFEFYEHGLHDPDRPDLHWKEIREAHGGEGTRLTWWDLFSPVAGIHAGTGEQIHWGGFDHWGHGPLSFHFEFPFYDQRFSSARVNNTGWLGFTSMTRSLVIQPRRPMPDPEFMDYKIAFQWAVRDMGRSDTNGHLHKTPNNNTWFGNGPEWEAFRDTHHAYTHNWDAHTWVFTWNRWVSPFARTPPELDTGQIELRSDGSIILRYKDYELLPNANEYTFGGPFFFSAGLQDGGATRGMSPIFRRYTDPVAPTPGSVLVIRPGVAAAWILPDLTAGSLASLEGESTLRITLDAGQLPPGVYQSSIVIDSDDTDGNAALRIPVTFTVSETAPSLVVTAPSSDLTAEPGDDLPVTVNFEGAGTPAGPVEILKGDEVLAELPGTGGSFLWENLPGGFHELSARVTLQENGHTVYAPVREIRAGKGLRLRWEIQDFPMFSESLVGNPTQLLQPPVVSRSQISAERFDITPVTLDPAQISWWGSTTTRDEYERDGSFSVGNEGRELRLVSNNYRKHPFTYTVTPNTILEFEFRAFNEPGSSGRSHFVYGLGFAENNTLNANRVFRLHGERNWGISAFYGTYPYSNGFHSGRRPWMRYRIPVGQFYTGDMQHIVFVAYLLNGFRDSDAAFRNLRVYESTESEAFSYAWSFNDTDREVDTAEAVRTYFSPGTKEISVTVSDGPHSAAASRVLELPGSEAFRVVVNFQPENRSIPAGFVVDTGKVFADRGNDLSYGWHSDMTGQTRDDNWLMRYRSEQGRTRMRMGSGTSWRMAVPNGMYTVTVHTGASEENSNALLRFNGEVLLDRNIGIQDYAEGSLTLPVSDGEIVISSHRNTASLQFLEVTRVSDVQRPPVASFTLTPQTGDAPLPVAFDASDSFDSDGVIVDYAWDFGDGYTGSGMEITHSYTLPGIYNVTLTVTDDDGLAGLTTLSVVVHGEAQPAVWVTPPPLPPPVPPSFGEPQPQPRRELSEDGGSLFHSVVLTTAPAQNVTVSIGTGDRVMAEPAMLTFTPANWDQPQTVQISAVDNEVVDGDEWVTISAAATSGDPAYNGLNGAPFDVFVLDNDAYGTLQFTQSALTVMEDHGTLVLEVTRTGGQSGELTATFSTVDGTALAGEDYTAVSGTLTWAHNDTATKTLSIPILDDEMPEPPETFQVQLTSAINVPGDSVLGSPAAVTVTILDDDNQAPAIILQSPANGATFEAGDVVPLEALVTSTTATIREVRFFVNGSLVDTRTSPVSGSLYRFNWVAALGATSWQVQAVDVNDVSETSDVRNLSVTPVPNLGSGGFLREIFRGLPTGTSVDLLRNFTGFPDNPDEFAFITSGALEYREDTGNYGTRLRAYFVAPKTGAYFFYLAARERAELWLSTDDTPANGVKILNNVGAQNMNSWSNASQRSAAVSLVAGQRYYLEALHKAGGSNTRHIQVGVELPGGQLERPIPLAFLEPFDGVKVESSTQLVLVPEGDTTEVQVRLRQQPLGNPILQASLIHPVNGGESLEVLGSGQITFTAANWNQWQTLTLYAAPDADAVDGEATLRLALDNGTWWDITAREIDAELNHPPTVVIRSPTVSPVNLPSGVGLRLTAEAEDLDIDPLTALWERISGPGTVSFDDASRLQTGARFSADGEYLLRVTVNDGEYSASAEVTVRVNPEAVTGTNILTTRGGSLSIDGTSWTLSGAGTWQEPLLDSQRFAYTEMSGDFDVSGRIASITGTGWSYTGLQVRNSLSAGSRHFTAGASLSSGSRFGLVHHRSSDGASRQGGDNLPGTSSDGWVRVTRSGNTFRAFHSTNGTAWTERTSINISMNDTVLVGIMIHNFDDGPSLSTATWTNVTLPSTVDFAPLVDAGPDALVNLGASHTLSASFSADYLPQGPLETQWFRQSGPGVVYANPSPPTAPDASVSFELPGTYVLRYLVSNGEAVTFDDVTLTVETSDPFPPVITQAPQAQTVLLGGTAVFSVTASGLPVPDYQWYRNGDAIPGATGTILEIESVQLSDEGLYHVRVSNSQGHAESVPVSLEVTVPPPGPQLFARVNFQTNIDAPAGWLRDIGEVYGDRGNGFQYGWNLDNTASARRRNAGNSPDPQHDTLLHMQLNGSFTWEIAVPNGTYQVRIVAGDPDFINSTYRINVEDTLVVNGAPTSQNRWVEGEATVEVSDGRLTVSNAANAVNNKINLIEIYTEAEPPSGYEAWAMQLPAGARGKQDRMDGVPNLLRYALGGDADTPASALRIVGHIHAQGMQVQFPRVNDPRLTYELWGSGDLIHWGDEPVWWGIGGGPDTLLLENPPPLWFLQLRVRHQ